MWISFTARREFALKVLLGGVNGISGKAVDLTKTAEPNQKQDYVVVPGQRWLDGIATAPAQVKQFVAVPYGSGYSIEQQVSNHGFRAMNSVLMHQIVDRQRDYWRHANPGDSELPASPKKLGWLLGHGNTTRARIHPWRR